MSRADFNAMLQRHEERYAHQQAEFIKRVQQNAADALAWAETFASRAAEHECYAKVAFTVKDAEALAAEKHPAVSDAVLIEHLRWLGKAEVERIVKGFTITPSTSGFLNAMGLVSHQAMCRFYEPGGELERLIRALAKLEVAAAPE